MDYGAFTNDILFVLLYGGVTMLDVVAAVYLLLRRGNAIAPKVTSPVLLRRWAAVFMLCEALSHMYWLFYATHPSPSLYVIVCGLDLILLFPTITGVLLSMLQDRHRPIWPVSAVLAPAVVLLILCVIRGDEALYVPLSVYVITSYALMVLYMLFAVRHYGRWLRENYADLENKEVWQSFLILAVFLLFFVNYSNITGESPIPAYLMQIVNIILVGLLLWRVETLQQLSESNPMEKGAEPAEDVQKTSAPMAIPANIGPLLKKFCEDRQLYLQNDLTLSQLAQIIGTNRYYLSQYFAQQDLTYNAYINNLRICHFVRLCREAVAEQRIVTAQQLANESGFRSYSTFSAAFKQNMGKTVTAWMRDQAE